MKWKKLIGNSLKGMLYHALLIGCGLFKFSKISLPAHVTSFSIADFSGEVTEGPLDLAKQFTEALEIELLRSTTLEKVAHNGDIDYKGVIKSYTYSSPFKTGGTNNSEQEAVLRLTIVVEVSYNNSADKEKSFQAKKFSASADMLASENKERKAPELVDEIFKKLIDDIVNATIGEDF